MPLRFWVISKMNMEDDYRRYLDPNVFFPSEEFNSYFEEGASVGYYESSSPEGAQEQSKNIVSERNRRDKLNKRLYALRAVVPIITKMDKASTVKDAIGYIQSLHEEERRIQEEISELESSNYEMFNLDQEHHSTTLISSFSAPAPAPRSSISPSHPIQLLELRVSGMGERTIAVSLTCSKRRDTMLKLCQIFESLNLKIITANITAFSGRLLKTVFLQGDEEEKEVLRLKIEAAIAALNDPESPITV